MIRIAVLGDIGSGKSHIAKQFGYPVFNADYEVARLYKKSKKNYYKLKKKFPKYIFSFPIKKAEILNAVVAKKNNLDHINEIVHPEVRIRLNRFIIKNKKRRIIVLDIPLLMENKINKKNDVIVFVDSKKKEINKRLKKKYKDNLKIIKRFEKVQLPVELKRKKSNFIIKNNFKNNNVKKNVKNVLGYFSNA